MYLSFSRLQGSQVSLVSHTTPPVSHNGMTTHITSTPDGRVVVSIVHGPYNNGPPSVLYPPVILPSPPLIQYPEIQVQHPAQDGFHGSRPIEQLSSPVQRLLSQLPAPDSEPTPPVPTVSLPPSRAGSPAPSIKREPMRSTHIPPRESPGMPFEVSVPPGGAPQTSTTPQPTRTPPAFAAQSNQAGQINRIEHESEVQEKSGSCACCLVM